MLKILTKKQWQNINALRPIGVRRPTSFSDDEWTTLKKAFEEPRDNPIHAAYEEIIQSSIDDLAALVAAWSPSADEKVLVHLAGGLEALRGLQAMCDTIRAENKSDLQ